METPPQVDIATLEHLDRWQRKSTAFVPRKRQFAPASMPGMKSPPPRTSRSRSQRIPSSIISCAEVTPHTCTSLQRLTDHLAAWSGGGKVCHTVRKSLHIWNLTSSWQVDVVSGRDNVGESAEANHQNSTFLGEGRFVESARTHFSKGNGSAKIIQQRTSQDSEQIPSRAKPKRTRARLFNWSHEKQVALSRSWRWRSVEVGGLAGGRLGAWWATVGRPCFRLRKRMCIGCCSVSCESWFLFGVFVGSVYPHQLAKFTSINSPAQTWS